MYFCRVEVENFCFCFVHSGSVCYFIRGKFCLIHSGSVFYLIRGEAYVREEFASKVGGGSLLKNTWGEFYAIFPIS